MPGKKLTTSTFTTQRRCNTVDKNTNQDDAQHMERGVMNVASSTILKMHARVPGAVWSTPLKRKLYMNKSLALKYKFS